MDSMIQRHKRLLSTAGVLAILILFAFGVNLTSRRHSHNPLSDAKVGFTFLMPNKLPPGFSVKSKHIYVSHGTNNTLTSAAVEMSFRSQDAVYSIQEWRATNENIYTSLHNFNTSTSAVTCTQSTSNEGHLFRLCHWIDYGKVSVYEVESIIDGTYVHTTFPAKIGQTITMGELQSFVDSLHMADPSNISISADTV